MKLSVLLVAAGIATLVAQPASAALTVETSQFIGTTTNFTGFEAIGSTSTYQGGYVEDGIAVDYVGTIAGGGIWTDSQTPAEGRFSWYPNGGGFGYTRITFADASEAQFAVGAGFFGGSPGLAYDVLLDGVSIGSGVAGPVDTYNNGFRYYGFSGAVFDELRLQVRLSPEGFVPGQSDAGAFDAISLNVLPGLAVPEPATWAMMIGGFGMVGGAMRRRRSVAVRAALA